LGDSAERRRVLQSDSIDAVGMSDIGLALALPLQDADEVFRRQFPRAATAEEQEFLALAWHECSILIGQPSRSVPLPASLHEPLRLAFLFFNSRFDDGDSVAGAEAAGILERAIGTPLDPRPDFALARFAAGQRALDLGRLETAARAVADLRNPRVPADSAWLAELPSRFALILESELAARRQSPELPRLLTRLDSVMTNPGDFGAFGLLPRIGNLVAARLYHQQGSLPQALAAIRRHSFGFGDPLVATYQLEEGRLAALNGDREGAIHAYRRYLAFRSDAEPRLQPQVAAARAELEALARENSDR